MPWGVYQRKPVKHSKEFELIQKIRYGDRSCAVSSELDAIKTYYLTKHNNKKLRRTKKIEKSPYSILYRYQKCIELRAKMIDKEPPKALYKCGKYELTVTAIKSYTAILKKYDPNANTDEVLEAYGNLLQVRGMIEQIKTKKLSEFLYGRLMPTHLDGDSYTVEDIQTRRIFPLSIERYDKFAYRLFHRKARNFSKYFRGHREVNDIKSYSKPDKKMDVSFGYGRYGRSGVCLVLFKDYDTNKLRFTFIV